MKPFTHHPVYVYEVHGGRTWGGDSEDFCSFCFVLTKDSVSVKDFIDMFGEAAKLDCVGYGEKFLRDAAKRLCAPEKKGEKRKVPHWRTVEFGGYRWSFERFGGTHGAGILFDNANSIPIDYA